MKRIRIASAAALACWMLASAEPAQAGPVFDVNAVTVLTVNNSAGGTFSPSDVLMGSIELSNAALIPGSVLGPADIIGFSFMVGGLTLTSDDAGPPQFRAVVSDMAGSFDFFRLLFTTTGPAGGCDAMCITEFGKFPTSRNRVNVQNVSLDPSGSRRLDIFGATFVLQQRNAPEPFAASMLGLGVLACLAVARRRRAR